MVLLIILTILFVIYSSLIIYYQLAWQAIPVFNSVTNVPHTRISVIIPARNEEKNITALLTALQQQTYPKHLFEIIVVDDQSTDKTATLVQNFDEVKLITISTTASTGHKKSAIEAGINSATGDFIVTTDADCLPPPRWLATIAACKEKTNAVFIAAPVLLKGKSTVLEIFQVLDFMILQGITGAAVYKKLFAMCNGANLGYDKKVFIEVGGFSGINHIATGDDMLLMHKIWQKYPERIVYLKSSDAIVVTNAMTTWKDFLNQRIRWASKANHYKDWKIFAVLLVVYLTNLGLLCLLFATVFNPLYGLMFLGFIAMKTIIELPFMASLTQFFQQKKILVYFFFFQPLHILYTVVAGLFGQMGKYEWKGRRVK